MEQLRSDLEGLITELADLSHRNDELMTAKDSDLAVIQNLDAQLKDYKRKYEAAKTELRSLKGAFFAGLLMSKDLNALFLSNFPIVPSDAEGRD